MHSDGSHIILVITCEIRGTRNFSKMTVTYLSIKRREQIILYKCVEIFHEKIHFKTRKKKPIICAVGLSCHIKNRKNKRQFIVAT